MTDNGLNWLSPIGWSIGMVVLGMVFGSIADDVEAMLVNQPELAEFFAQLEGASLLDSYLATAGLFIGLLAGGYAVSAILSAHSEERSGPGLLWSWLCSLGISVSC